MSFAVDTRIRQVSRNKKYAKWFNAQKTADMVKQTNERRTVRLTADNERHIDLAVGVHSMEQSDVWCGSITTFNR